MIIISQIKSFRAIKNLESWFNPQATIAVEYDNYGREITLDQVNLALFSADFFLKSQQPMMKQ
jgi:hypothetical protein